MFDREKYFSTVLQEIQDEREADERASAERFEREELESLKIKSEQEHKSMSEYRDPMTLITEEYLVTTHFSDQKSKDATLSPTGKNPIMEKKQPNIYYNTKNLKWFSSLLNAGSMIASPLLNVSIITMRSYPS